MVFWRRRGEAEGTTREVDDGLHRKWYQRAQKSTKNVDELVYIAGAMIIKSV